MSHHSKEELHQALTAITSTISKCQKAMPKLKQNSAQLTLLERRVKAFTIAVELINKELLHLQILP